MIRIMKLGSVPNEQIFARTDTSRDVAATVKTIIEDVKKRGDKALFEYTAKFDGAVLSSLEVSPEEFEEAWLECGAEFTGILEGAAENIRLFHSLQKREGFKTVNAQGAVVGQKIVPVEKAGLYVPGGTAAYPSTVLMDSIPAKIAGCGEVIIATPPGRNGKVPAAILAAAKIAGVDRVFKIGGAQAIAAMAFGTETVPKTDKIVGPGNAFVAEAKRQVFGAVSIDMIAGPSEILIVADGKSRASWVAADMLSQAEHDRMASAVLVTDSEELAEAVSLELERQIPLLERADIARASIDNNGKIIVAADIWEAVSVANEIAPEHLELSVDDPYTYLAKVKNAGSVFLGRYCPEALGDYFAGPNHTLPTGGTARFSSALSVDDFVKKIQFIEYDEISLAKCAAKVNEFAKKEGLTGHGRSVMIRAEESGAVE
ncbi:MAG: histidinol dehydrogenase [Clostridia bacterium]|nr:histidinol dehydrogenase [Clostridia bacterium]